VCCRFGIFKFDLRMLPYSSLAIFKHLDPVLFPIGRSVCSHAGERLTVHQQGGTTPEQAAEFVSKTGAFQVNFTEDDARVVLNAMVYDGIAELAGGGGTLDTLASLLGPDANITEQPGSAASGAAAAASKKRKRVRELLLQWSRSCVC